MILDTSPDIKCNLHQSFPNIAFSNIISLCAKIQVSLKELFYITVSRSLEYNESIAPDALKQFPL